jgi:hypothetical protein
MERREIDRVLTRLENQFVRDLVSPAIGIREGRVMSLAGVAPYRRIDCDGRALCYVRSRPLRRAIRVDVSGLWFGDASKLVLLLKDEGEVVRAIEYLHAVVAADRRRRATPRRDGAPLDRDRDPA